MENELENEDGNVVKESEGIRCRPFDKVWSVVVVTRPPGIE